MSAFNVVLFLLLKHSSLLSVDVLWGLMMEVGSEALWVLDLQIKCQEYRFMIFILKTDKILTKYLTEIKASYL